MMLFDIIKITVIEIYRSYIIFFYSIQHFKRYHFLIIKKMNTISFASSVYYIIYVSMKINASSKGLLLLIDNNLVELE